MTGGFEQPTPNADIAATTRRWMIPVAAVACVLVVAAAGWTLMAWATEAEMVTKPVLGAAAMQPLSAMCVGLLALASLLQFGSVGRVRNATGVIVGATVAVLACWSLAGYVVSTSVPLDGLLFESRLDQSLAWPGRPSLQTLVVLVALAGLLMGISSPDTKRSRGLSVGVVGISIGSLTVVISSLIAGAGEISFFDRTLGMSWPTATVLMVLSLAMAGIRPERPPVAWLIDGTLDSFTVLRVLPVLLVVPLVVRMAQLAGEAVGFDTYDANFFAEAVALSMVGITLVGTALAKQRAERELAARQAIYGTAVTALSEGLVIRDPEGHLVMANPAAVEITSGIYQEVPMGDSVPPAIKVFDEKGGRIAAKDMPTSVTLRTGMPVRSRMVQLGEGEDVRWVLVNAVPLGESGGAVTTMTDVTDRSHAERALAEAEERFRTAFENAPIGMAMVEPTGHFKRVNPAFCALLGRAREDMESMTWLEISHPDDVEENLELSRTLLKGTIPSYSMDKRYRHADGSWVWTTLNVSLIRRADGTPEHFVAQILDLRDRKRLEEELSHMAMHDHLTELPNRRLVVDRLEQALVRSARIGERVGVIYVDLDGFKMINDTYGHDTGDRVLIDVSRRMREVLRSSDTAGRLGGDEFIVISEGLTDADALDEIVHRVEQALQGELEIGGHAIALGASVGACLANPSDDAETLLRVADGAMYAVKRARRAANSNRLHVVRDEPDADSRA